MERDIEKHAAFTFQMGLLYSPEQLVFVDECSADQRMGRGYGYARQGRRAVQKAFSFEEDGKRHHSFSPSISSNILPDTPFYLPSHLTESSPLKLQRVLSQTSHLWTSLMASWIT